MKKFAALLFAAIMMVSIFGFALADDTAPKYSAMADFDSEGLLLVGSVAHSEGTPEVERLYARITYFMADGSYIVVPAVVAADGTFESMISGNIVHIGIQVVNSAKIVPGTYTRYGGYEFDVK